MSNARKAAARGRGYNSRTPAEKAAQAFSFGGNEIHRLLIDARNITGGTYRGLARRFKRSPKVLAEFSVAHALGADEAALKEILSQLRNKQVVEVRKGRRRSA